MVYDIYTDGACSGNPGKGGYAFVIVCNDKPKLKLYGHKEHTTNNCMELTAIVRAIKHAQSQYYESPGINDFKIYSDSAYCVNSINQGWVKFWRANNWITKSGEPIKNRELWEELLSMLESRKYKISFVKVKGHSGNKWNEMVDYLAKQGVLLEGKKDLSKGTEGV